MRYLPIFMDLKKVPVLIVGGGSIALRKARLLVEAGANVRVVAPRIESQLRDIVELWLLREFNPRDIEGMALVFVATNDTGLNQYIAELSKCAGIPVNVVDNPKLCRFIMPSIIDRDPITIAISTAGQAPVLARVLRAKLEAWIPARYGQLAKLAGAFRQQVQERIPGRLRRQFWEGVLTGPIAEQVLAGQKTQAYQQLQQLLVQSSEAVKPIVGQVALVGAGPGDPELLTLKALRLIQRADVVLYDRLVNEQIIKLIRRDAQRIYVGKSRNHHALSQAQINTKLVELAEQGQQVVRLKGGDPFLFGRGGEELEALVGARIPFQVVPGITAAVGCASYAGIPLTHRDYAQSVRFLTGHFADGICDFDWQALATGRQTLVFYMGLGALQTICQQLVRHGLSPSTPVALIERGTTALQRVITTTVADVGEQNVSDSLVSPTLIIIGEVVKLHHSLRWFNTQNNLVKECNDAQFKMLERS